MLIQVRATTRSAPRHRVEIPCEIITPSTDAPTLAWATDMSADGLWIDERSDLDLGEELVVCFKPGIWWRAHELMVFAHVTRTSPGLRGDDDNPGLGVAFADLSSNERWALRAWLRPRPEKAPSRRKRSRKRSSARDARAPSHGRLAPPDGFVPDGFMTSPFARRLS